MAERRLGVTVIPGAGWRASDVRTVAREAEDAGFDAVFNTEVNSDTMATAQLATLAECLVSPSRRRSSRDSRRPAASARAAIRASSGTTITRT